MNIHKFEATGDAYDECQCNEDIKTGDTLVIEEKDFRQYKGRDEDGFRVYADDPKDIVVVGLAWAWPLAVTVETGALHDIQDNLDSYQKVVADAGITREQVEVAVAEAARLNAPVRPLWVEYLKEDA
jgi:hypothetical protein